MANALRKTVRSSAPSSHFPPQIRASGSHTLAKKREKKNKIWRAGTLRSRVSRPVPGSPETILEFQGGLNMKQTLKTRFSVYPRCGPRVVSPSQLRASGSDTLDLAHGNSPFSV